MSPHRIFWWVTIVALVVILALAGAQAARAIRELKRATVRVDEFADLPMLKALERTEARLRSLEAAFGQLEPLAGRALAAIAIIRKGPIPPELIGAFVRLRTEIAAFRRFAGR
ncbi:MAG TPA: hypothetical protein VGX96_16610 [Candidatus Elarobacter sp.]|nr:hypothetical protein [Candidatus Elarobacter sp.]